MLSSYNFPSLHGGERASQFGNIKKSIKHINEKFMLSEDWKFLIVGYDSPKRVVE